MHVRRVFIVIIVVIAYFHQMLATSASFSFVCAFDAALRLAIHQLRPTATANAAERTTTGIIKVLAMLASRHSV